MPWRPYLAWVMLLFRKPPWLIAAIAFVSCLAVEFFKLTGIPAANQHVFLVRWFLGMIFDVVNLGYYFTGGVDRTRRLCDPRFKARHGAAVVRRFGLAEHGGAFRGDWG